MYARFARSIGDQRWFRPFARRLLPPIDRTLVRFGLRATPWPTLNLTTSGAHTGKARTVPLYFLEHGEELAVIASNFGRREPDWSRNLHHDAACTLLLRRRSTAATARLATDDEWHTLFERFATFYPAYQEYLHRAGRDVPIWLLRRVAATA